MSSDSSTAFTRCDMNTRLPPVQQFSILVSALLLPSYAPYNESAAAARPRGDGDSALCCDRRQAVTE